ncbi:MAG: carboxypeptidase-like regulatory domain-containing protein, partial [Flavobacteriaceae bacterium]|nr:carboxypeptidase-like regulatory domain-containing protein [Flavobacteriaceae bacterium]
MRILLVAIVLIFTQSVFAQQKGNVKGIILDKEMGGEPLAFADVSVKDAKVSSQTDFDGNYFLNIKEGTYTLQVTFAGYEKVEIPNVTIKAGETLTLNNVMLEALKISHNIKNSSQKS